MKGQRQVVPYLSFTGSKLKSWMVMAVHKYFTAPMNKWDIRTLHVKKLVDSCRANIQLAWTPLLPCLRAERPETNGARFVPGLAKITQESCLCFDFAVVLPVILYWLCDLDLLVRGDTKLSREKCCLKAYSSSFIQASHSSRIFYPLLCLQVLGESPRDSFNIVYGIWSILTALENCGSGSV